MNLPIPHIIGTGPSVPISWVPLCTSKDGLHTYLSIHVTVRVYVVLVLTTDLSWIMVWPHMEVHDYVRLSVPPSLYNPFKHGYKLTSTD